MYRRDPIRYVLQALWAMVYTQCAMLLVLVFIAILLATGARSQEHTHDHQQKHDALHEWYQTLMRPDMPTVSCCSERDCAATRAEMRNGRWWAMRADKWIEIPLSKIITPDLTGVESFDTQAHICFYPWITDTDEILCFVPPGGGI